MAVRPGVAALVLVGLLAAGLGLALWEPSPAEASDQVAVVICGDDYGTGWWVNPEYMVTAFHVVDDCADQGSVVAVRGDWVSTAVIEAVDRDLDVALLRPLERPEQARGLPLSYRLSLGDKVYVVGYPIQLYVEVGRDVRLMSLAPRVLEATVAWVSPVKPVFEFTPGTDVGNSGGPIVSAETGGVVGMVVYARGGVVNEGFYGLRMDALARFLEASGVEYSVEGTPGSALALALAGAGLAVAVIVALQALGRRLG